jgi:hypothetical protein
MQAGGVEQRAFVPVNHKANDLRFLIDLDPRGFVGRARKR